MRHWSMDAVIHYFTVWLWNGSVLVASQPTDFLLSGRCSLYFFFRWVMIIDLGRWPIRRNFKAKERNRQFDWHQMADTLCTWCVWPMRRDTFTLTRNGRFYFFAFKLLACLHRLMKEIFCPCPALDFIIWRRLALKGTHRPFPFTNWWIAHSDSPCRWDVASCNLGPLSSSIRMRRDTFTLCAVYLGELRHRLQCQIADDSAHRDPSHFGSRLNSSWFKMAAHYWVRIKSPLQLNVGSNFCSNWRTNRSCCVWCWWAATRMHCASNAKVNNLIISLFVTVSVVNFRKKKSTNKRRTSRFLCFFSESLTSTTRRQRWSLRSRSRTFSLLLDAFPPFLWLRIRLLLSNCTFTEAQPLDDLTTFENSIFWNESYRSV